MTCYQYLSIHSLMIVAHENVCILWLGMHPYLMIMCLSLLMTAFIPASNYLSIAADDYWDIGFGRTFQSKQAQKHVVWIGNEGDTTVLSSAQSAVIICPSLPMIICPSLPMIIGPSVPMIIGTLVLMDLAKHSGQNKPKNMFFG